MGLAELGIAGGAVGDCRSWRGWRSSAELVGPAELGRGCGAGGATLNNIASPKTTPSIVAEFDHRSWSHWPVVFFPKKSTYRQGDCI